MNVYTTINISFEFVALLLAIAGFIGTLSFPQIGKQERRDFALFLAMLGLSALFNGLFSIFNGMDGETARNVVIASRFISTAAECWFTAFFNLYAIHLFRTSKKGYKAWGIAVFAIQGAMTILLVGNLFGGYIYSVGADNLYVRGIVFYLIPVVESIIWIVGAVLVFVNRKTMAMQDKIVFYIYCVLIATALLLQSFITQLSFLDAITILAIMVLLFGEQSKTTTRLLQESVAAEEARLETEKTKEKLLRSQVSPHFIYNALTAIQALPDNPERTKRAIGDFAKYLRQSLSTINENTLIPFEKELENVQVYFRLEKIRFGKSLQVEYDITEKDFDLPAMSVQILAENAVKHGVSVKREGGTVSIATKREDDDIVIIITDDGVGFDVNQPIDSSHIGIANVRNRIVALAGGSFEIVSELGRGTTATIRIPVTQRYI